MLKAFLRDFILKGIIIFIPLTLLIVLLTAGKSQPTIQNNFVRIENNLIFKGTSNVPYTGQITDTLQGKILQYDVKNGEKNGLFKVTDLKGNISYLGQIKNNKNEGQWTYFYKNGLIESQGDFKNDKLENKWTWYFKNGNLKAVGYYHKGKKEGKWITYNPDKTLKAIIYFRNDKQINIMLIKLPKSV